MPSPTQRTLALLRKLGYEAQVVERYNSFSKKRVDLFGCIDIVAVKPGEILGVQCTSDSNVAARMDKACSLPGVEMWIRAGGRFEVWGWGKKGARGKQKRWKVRRQRLYVEEG